MSLEGLEIEQHEEESEEVWLISYADLMTLLFGLFVLMYTFAMSRSPEEVEKVKEGVARSFGGSYVPPYQDLVKELKLEKERNAVLQDIAIEPLRNGLEVTFQSGLLFKTGEADLSDQMKDILRSVIQVISSNIDKDQIVVQGHTDDVPISSERFPSNWELSAVRASSVVREFIRFGFDPSRIHAVAFGESKPLFPNKSDNGIPIPANRAKNRRVVIKIVAPGYVDSLNEREKITN